MLRLLRPLRQLLRRVLRLWRNSCVRLLDTQGQRNSRQQQRYLCLFQHTGSQQHGGENRSEVQHDEVRLAEAACSSIGSSWLQSKAVTEGMSYRSSTLHHLSF